MPARILVVEDDQDIAQLVARYLDKAGYSAEIVGSGRDALKRIAAQGGEPRQNRHYRPCRLGSARALRYCCC